MNLTRKPAEKRWYPDCQTPNSSFPTANKFNRLTTPCDLPPPPSWNVSLLDTLYRVRLLRHTSTPGGFDFRLAYGVWGSVQVDCCWLWLGFSAWLCTTAAAAAAALWQRAVQRSDRVTSTRWNPKDTRVRARAQRWDSLSHSRHQVLQIHILLLSHISELGIPNGVLFLFYLIIILITLIFGLIKVSLGLKIGYL